jgi:AraC-like DNA-binding protein
MQKHYGSWQDYQESDTEIEFRQFEGDSYRIGLVREGSNDVTFTSILRNGLVLDLSGTKRHLTRMDGIRDETPTLRGDVCLVPRGMEVRFAWEVLGEHQTSVTLEFDSEILGTFLPEFEKDKFLNGHLLPGNYAPRLPLGILMRMLRQEVHPRLRRGRLFADSVLRLLAFEVATSHWSVPSRMPDAGGRPDPRIGRALDYIEDNFAADISLADIGNACGLSLTQLSARFQQHTGVTPYSYVIDRRLRLATELLRNTDTPIAQVAIETGFSDQQHLTRMVRARLKTTPGQMRKR